jgi:hypothetical protein
MVLNEKNSKQGGVCQEGLRGKESFSFMRFSRESLSINVNHKNPREDVMKKKLLILSFIMAIVFMMAGANMASAYTLTSSLMPNATSVDINPGDGGTTPGGMNNWIIGESGTSQLNLQWFWFKIGNTTTRLGDSIEIDENTTITPTITNNFSALDPDHIDIVYDYSGLEIYASYGITGGYNPPTGHINEVITFVNNTGATISNMRIYEYNDFDLTGTPENDTATVVSNTQIIQREGNAAIAEVTRSTQGAASIAYEIGEFPVLLNSIIAGNALSNNPAIGTEVALNDVSWAFSWDFSLANGGYFGLSKDKIVVTPVPTTLLLFGSGLMSLIGVGIRRRKS